MVIKKEKRAFERINLEDLRGSVELMDIVKSVSVVNASEEGVCVGGADFPVGSVVRLAIGSQAEEPDISLYCKVIWASQEEDPRRNQGYSPEHKQDPLPKDSLVSEAGIESARKQAASNRELIRSGIPIGCRMASCRGGGSGFSSRPFSMRSSSSWSEMPCLMGILRSSSFSE